MRRIKQIVIIWLVLFLAWVLFSEQLESAAFDNSLALLVYTIFPLIILFYGVHEVFELFRNKNTKNKYEQGRNIGKLFLLVLVAFTVVSLFIYSLINIKFY